MTQQRGARTRLAVDIGGTFTDLVLELPDRTLSAKLLTTPAAPDEAVIEGTQAILREAGVAATSLDLVIHGTTLATNALIERKGARTALVTTEWISGFAGNCLRAPVRAVRPVYGRAGAARFARSAPGGAGTPGRGRICATRDG